MIFPCLRNRRQPAAVALLVQHHGAVFWSGVAPPGHHQAPVIPEYRRVSLANAR